MPSAECRRWRLGGGSEGLVRGAQYCETKPPSRNPLNDHESRGRVVAILLQPSQVVESAAQSVGHGHLVAAQGAEGGRLLPRHLDASRQDLSDLASALVDEHDALALPKASRADHDAILAQLTTAGLVEEFTDDEGRASMRLTEQGVQVARGRWRCRVMRTRRCCWTPCWMAADYP
jgi:hypothetical protein